MNKEYVLSGNIPDIVTIYDPYVNDEEKILEFLVLNYGRSIKCGNKKGDVKNGYKM